MIISDIFDKGGIIVWILAAYSFIALTILFERMMRFILMPRPAKIQEKQLIEALRQGQSDLISHQIKGPEGRMVQGILHAYKEGISDLGRVAVRLGS
jgi:biopolymer transport protein ExbB